MTNKELELIWQLTEVAMTVAELRAENKILKDINEKLMQALRIHDVVGQSEQLKCHHQYVNAGTLQGDTMKKCLKCGDYVKAL
jgi:hypothetical protein